MTALISGCSRSCRRHANVQTTTNTYTQAVSDQNRAANSKVVEIVTFGLENGA